MNSRHTHGPWSIEHDSEWPMVMAGGKIVANVNPESFYAGVADLIEMPAEANARLIAAAPELLEALDAMERHFIRYNDTHNSLVLERARAAIAKATGSES